MAGKFKVGVKIKIEQGALNALLKNIKDVEQKAARKGIKQGINQLSKLVLAEAKARVPKRTGQLRKSLGRKVKSVRGGAAVYAVIKPRSGTWVKAGPGIIGRMGKGKKAGKVFVRKFRIEQMGPGLGAIDPVKYAHLVEYGRREVVRKKKKVLAGGGIIYGKRVRSVAPRPFLRPAWEKYRTQAQYIIASFVYRAIREHWKKKGR